MVAEKTSFIFYTEWEKPLSLLPPADQGRVMMAIIHYQMGEKDDLSDSPAAAMAFEFIRTLLDKDTKKWEEARSRRSESARNAANARWNKTNTDNANACERMRTHDDKCDGMPNDADDAQDAVNVNVNVNVNENVKEKESPDGDSKKKNPKPVKHKYGSFGNVLLTDDQYTRVQEDFPLDYDERIEELSEGIELHGYKYKNHYLALRKWAKKRDQELGRSSPTQKRAAPAKRSGVDRTGLAISPGYHDVDDAELYEVF